MDNQPNLSAKSALRFTDFALAPDVIDALARAGIERPTPIQESCIPPILAGKDVVGKAETGTGKTIGFGAPIISRMDTNRVAPQALVLTPTRELAQQVAGVLSELGSGRNLRVALVVGGVGAGQQILTLRGGAQIVVGTPGRVLEFLEDRTLSLVWCEVAVLDEADRMLDMGFIDDVTKILSMLPAERQTLLFSATIPPEVKELLHRFMKDPQIFSTASGLATVPEIEQLYVEADFPDKFKALQKILESYKDETVIIFCNTRRQAIDLDRMLWGHGYSAGALHGEHDQDVRFRVLQAFRSGDIKILVATDVASRGLDIDDVACVVNYEIPDDPGGYVHRIGRTGRAKKRGVATSIVSGKEWWSWDRILRDTGFPIVRLGPERVRKSRGHPGRRDRFRSRGGAARSGGAEAGSERGRGRGEAGGREARSREAVSRQAAYSGERAKPSLDAPAQAPSKQVTTMDTDANVGAFEAAKDASAEADAGIHAAHADAATGAGSQANPEHSSGGDTAAGDSGRGAPAVDDSGDWGEQSQVPSGSPEGAGGHAERPGEGRRSRRRRRRGRRGREREAGAPSGGEDPRDDRPSGRPHERGHGPSAEHGPSAGHGASAKQGALARHGAAAGAGDSRAGSGEEHGPTPRAGQPAGSAAPDEAVSGQSPSRLARDAWDRPQQDRPRRLKLEEIDDDFVKTDYFSVDHSIIERSQPQRGPEAHRGHGHGAGAERGPAVERGHRPHRGVGGGRGPGEEKEARREPGPASGDGPGGPGSGDAGRRRRRRRRSRRRLDGRTEAGGGQSGHSGRSSGGGHSSGTSHPKGGGAAPGEKPSSERRSSGGLGEPPV